MKFTAEGMTFGRPHAVSEDNRVVRTSAVCLVSNDRRGLSIQKPRPVASGRPQCVFENTFASMSQADASFTDGDAGESAFAEAEEEGVYVSTPQGLFTASGVWFQATEEMLRDYAGPVLQHVALAELVRRAERWLRSPMTLAAWMLPLALLLLSPWAAAGATLTLFCGWTLLCPSLASRRAAQVAGWMEQPWLQGLFYVLVLSILAAQGRLAAVGVGLAGFLLLRWGLVRRALRVPLRAAMRRLYPLPPEDQVLRAFILRAGLRHDVALPQLDRLRNHIARRWSQ